MAHSISAEKRIRQSKKHQARNRWSKRRVHEAVKEFDGLTHGGDKAKAEEAFRAASATLDRVAAKGAIHPNKAARKKSRLAKRLNAMKAGAKTTSGKKAAK